MFCIHCGSKLEPGFRFCMTCGRPVETPAQPVVPAQPQQPVIPVVEEQAAQIWEDVTPGVPETIPEVPAEEDVAVEPAVEGIPAQEPVAEPVVEEIPAQEPVTEPVVEEIPVQEPAQEPAQEEPVEAAHVYIPQQPQYQQPVYQQPVYQQPQYQQPVYQQPQYQQPQYQQPQYQQPVYQQPYQPAADAPEGKKAKTKPIKKEKKQAPNRGYGKRRGFFLGLLAWILCIAIFFVSMVPIALVSLRFMTSQQGIEEIVDNMDLEEMDAASFVTNVEPGEMTAIEYFAYEANYRGWNVSANELEEMIDESNLKTFFAEQLGGFLGNLYSGEDDHQLTARDVSKFLKDNADLIREITGERLTSSQCNEMAELIVEDLDMESISIKVLEDELGEAYKIVRFCLSWWMVAILAGVVFLLALLLWLVNRRSLIRTARDLSIVYLVLGIVLVLACLIPQILPTLWKDMPTELNMALTLAAPALETELCVALGVVALGLSQLLLYIISKVYYRCKYAKRASGE